MRHYPALFMATALLAFGVSQARADEPLPPDADPPVEAVGDPANVVANVTQVADANSQVAGGSASVDGSLNNNASAAMLNQATGGGLNQANVLSFAFVGGEGGGSAMAEATLSQVNTGNTVLLPPLSQAPGEPVTASITNSLNGNVGFVALNQSTGSNNNQANVIAFASVGGQFAFGGAAAPAP